MLLRDDLREKSGIQATSWTWYIKEHLQINDLGRPGSQQAGDEWKAAVSSATKSLVQQISRLPAHTATTRPAVSAAGSTMLPQCQRPGCGKPTWNGQPNEFCSRSCKVSSPASSPATSIAAQLCKRPGCGKTSWNGKANEFCSRSCKAAG